MAQVGQGRLAEPAQARSLMVVAPSLVGRLPLLVQVPFSFTMSSPVQFSENQMAEPSLLRKVRTVLPSFGVHCLSERLRQVRGRGRRPLSHLGVVQWARSPAAEVGQSLAAAGSWGAPLQVGQRIVRSPDQSVQSLAALSSFAFLRSLTRETPLPPEMDLR